MGHSVMSKDPQSLRENSHCLSSLTGKALKALAKVSRHVPCSGSNALYEVAASTTETMQRIMGFRRLRKWLRSPCLAPSNVFHMCVVAQTSISARSKLASIPGRLKKIRRQLPSNLLPRVLCVDDDEDSRIRLITLLRHELVEANVVATAAKALSSTQTERFDLYLLPRKMETKPQ